MITTEHKIIAKSVKNNELLATYIGRGEKYVIVLSCIHGDEPQGKNISLKLIAYYEENKSLLVDKTLILVPVVNPDGYEAISRVNANGVDLNRNFPSKNWELSVNKDDYYSGLKPASEPETQAMVGLIEQYCPKLIIALHQPYKLINYDGPAIKYADVMSKLNNYKIASDIGYPTPGSLGTYAGIERQIPVITLELPESEPDEIVWEDNNIAIATVINLI